MRGRAMSQDLAAAVRDYAETIEEEVIIKG
jgi:hypothetical protein